MIQYLTHWIQDPAHIALLVSEVLAFLPLKYKGLLQGAIKALAPKDGAQ